MHVCVCVCVYVCVRALVYARHGVITSDKGGFGDVLIERYGHPRLAGQCVPVYYSVLQCVAVSGSVWQCLAVSGSVLQCTAVSCSMLQCVAALQSRAGQ